MMTNEYIFTGKVLKSELMYEYTIHRNEGESLQDWLGTDYNAYLAIDDKKEYRTDAQLSKWEEIR